MVLVLLARALLCSLTAIVGIAALGVFAGAPISTVERRAPLSAETRSTLLFAALTVMQSALIVAVVVQRRRRHEQLRGELAHELNQPLTAILCNAQAARRFLARQPPEIGEVMIILDDIVLMDERAAGVVREALAATPAGPPPRDVAAHCQLDPGPMGRLTAPDMLDP